MPEKYPLVECWRVFSKQFCYIGLIEAVLLMAEFTVDRNEAVFFEYAMDFFLAH